MNIAYKMDHVDSAFFSVDTERTPQIISAVCLLDREPKWDWVRTQLATLLKTGSFVRLQEKVVRRPPGWLQDESFDLDLHLERIQSEQIQDRKALFAKINECIGKPLDMSRAPWRLTVINGNDGFTESALVLSIHHGAADGVRLVQLLEAIASDASGIDGDPTEAINETAKESRSFGHSLKCMRKFLAEGIIPCNASPLNGDTSFQRQLTPFEIDRRQLDSVFPGEETSTQDVLYSIVAQTVRSYHEALGAPNKDMRVVIPVAVPPKSFKGGLGNHLVLSTITLPVSEPNLIDRWQKVRQAFIDMKNDGTIAAYEFAAGAICRCLPKMLHRPAWETMVKKTNFVCTILPGPTDALIIGGAKVIAIYGVPAPVLKHGAGFGFITYAGKVCGSIVTDDKVIPDADRLAQCLSDAVQLHSNASTTKPLFEDCLAPRQLEELTLKTLVHETPQAEQLDAILNSLRNEIAGMLRLKNVNEISPRDRLIELGLDSMTAIDLQHRLQNACGFSLPQTLIFDYPNLETLSNYLLTEFRKRQPDERLNQVDDDALPEDVMEERLDEMSEAELAAMLEQELE